MRSGNQSTERQSSPAVKLCLNPGVTPAEAPGELPQCLARVRVLKAHEKREWEAKPRLKIRVKQVEIG
jgi:hypothetical protein